MDNEILGVIANIGFPAFLCYYLMTRINKTLDNLTNAINHQTAILYSIYPLTHIKTYENDA